MDNCSRKLDKKRELDDSGCVQDDAPPTKKALMGDVCEPYITLLDLSDDVLLMIFKFCTPFDLQALGYTCSRLSRLIKEHSLWKRVDARGRAVCYARLNWMLDNGLYEATHTLLLSGSARQSKGCVCHKKEESIPNSKSNGHNGEGDASEQASTSNGIHQGEDSGASASGNTEESNNGVVQERTSRAPVRPPAYVIIDAASPNLPRYFASPPWQEVTGKDDSSPETTDPSQQWCVSRGIMKRLVDQCSLHTLALDYCRFDCSSISMAHFPATLKWLSLRGTRCYNLPLDRSFLFKINDYLPLLEYVCVCQCAWLQPHALLPLSKLRALRELCAQRCRNLHEFVAYASLAARYGFQALRVLDGRGSPLGDAEVSALGWLPELTRLYLSPPRRRHLQPSPTVPLPQGTVFSVTLSAERPPRVDRLDALPFQPTENDSRGDSSGSESDSENGSESGSEEESPSKRRNFMPIQRQVPPELLVTDASIQRFGHSDSVRVNYVLLGPAPMAPTDHRPSKSKLTVLHCAGYCGITDASLHHLATAAPSLVELDLRNTRVTQRGIDLFTAMRPDCVVMS